MRYSSQALLRLEAVLPSLTYITPFDSSRDALINPGVKECRFPGTQFLRVWLRRYLEKYKDAKSPFLYRACILHSYHVELGRRIYYVERETGEIHPIHSFVMAARLSAKCFEYLCSRYLTKKHQSPPQVMPTTPTSLVVRNEECCSVKLARKLHKAFSEQFATAGRVEEYSSILNDSAGFGKYTALEHSAFGVLEEMFPEFLDVDDGVEDFYDPSIDNFLKKNLGRPKDNITMDEKVLNIECQPH
jgi:hypothetical protein